MSARGQPSASGNALDTRRQIQGYASAQVDYVGTGLAGAGVNFREADDDVDRAIRGVEHGVSSDPYRLPPPASIDRGRSHFAETQLVREVGPQASRLYVSYRQSVAFGQTGELLRDADSGARLGTTREAHRFGAERLKVNLSFQDSLAQNLYLLTWLQTDLNPSALDVAGVSTVAARAGPTAFRNEESSRFARAGALLGVGLGGAWGLELFAGYTASRVGDAFAITDVGPVFGVGTAPAPYRLDYSVTRRQRSPTVDARVRTRVGPQTFGFGLHATQKSLADAAAGASLEPVVGPQGYEQRFTSTVAYGHYNRETAKHDLTLEPALQLIEYSRAEVATQRVAPLLDVRYGYRLPRDYRLSASLSTAVEPFGESLIWTTALPLDSRELALGYRAESPFTRSTRSSISVLKLSRDGTLLIGALSGLARDRSLNRVLAQREGFLVYEPAIFDDLKSLDAHLAYGGQLTAKQTMRFDLRYSASSFDREGATSPTAFRSRRLGGNVSVVSRWTALFHTTIGAAADLQRQRNESAGRDIEIDLATVSPHVRLQLRASAVKASVESRLLVRPGFTVVPVLDAQVTYRKPLRPWYVSLAGDDLLRYSGSSFNRLDVGPAVATEVEFARLRGFITLGLGYTFEPRRAGG